MSKENDDKNKCTRSNHAKRRSKIYQLFHPKAGQTSSKNIRRKNHRSKSTISQFDKLKSLISNLFPMKTVRVKPEKRNKTRRRNSFTFRRKKKNKNKPKLKQTHSCQLKPTRSSRSHHNDSDYRAVKLRNNGTTTPPEISLSISNTEEYLLDDSPRNKPRLLAAKSSSCMRSFDKRPEYVTYYPPDSMMEVFNKMSMGAVNENIYLAEEEEDETSGTIAVKTHTRNDEVDQIFELASRTLDYCNFYGYSSSNNEESGSNDSSLCSFIDKNYLDTLSWK